MRLGTEILRLTLAYEKLIHQGTSRSEAVHSLSRQNKHFSPEFFRALVELDPNSEEGEIKQCRIEALVSGMIHPTGDPHQRGGIACLQRSGGHFDASIQAQELARTAGDHGRCDRLHAHDHTCFRERRLLTSGDTDCGKAAPLCFRVFQPLQDFRQRWALPIDQDADAVNSCAEYQDSDNGRDQQGTGTERSATAVVFVSRCAHTSPAAQRTESSTSRRPRAHRVRTHRRQHENRQDQRDHNKELELLAFLLGRADRSDGRIDRAVQQVAEKKEDANAASTPGKP
jgi:hypothetical protein